MFQISEIRKRDLKIKWDMNPVECMNVGFCGFDKEWVLQTGQGFMYDVSLGTVYWAWIRLVLIADSRG